MSEEYDSLLGRVIADEYRLEERLAESEGSALYRAERRSAAGGAVIRLVPLASGGAGLESRLLERAKTLAEVEHSSLARILASGSEDGYVHLVFPSPVGRTLRSLLEATRRIDLARALPIVKELASGLSAVHALGVVHGKVAAENVYLRATPGGFDVATLLEAALETEGQTPSDDVRALGMLAAEMVTGVTPTLTSTGACDLHLERVALTDRAALPDELITVLRKATGGEGRESRYTIEQFLHEFTRAVVPEARPPAPLNTVRPAPVAPAGGTFGNLTAPQPALPQATRGLWRRVRLLLLTILAACYFVLGYAIYFEPIVRQWAIWRLLALEQSSGSQYPLVRRLLLLKPTANVNDLIRAVIDDDRERFEVALASGIDVNGIGDNGRTPLHEAVASSRPLLAMRLLGAGAKAETKDSRGLTALATAVERNDVDLAAALLTAGAEVEVDDTRGTSVLGVAVRHNNVEMVKLLLAGGAKVEAIDGKGETTLHAASKRGTEAIVEALLAKTAKVDLLDAEGRTPLIAAVQAGQEKTAQLLLTRGADPLLRDAEGKSALDYARERSYERLVQAVAASPPAAEAEAQPAPEESRPARAPMEKAPTEEPVRKASLYTKLRSVGEPRYAWKRSAGALSLECEVDVRNIGDATAEQIVVQVRLRRHEAYALQGPATLEPKMSGSYKGKFDISPTFVGRAKMEIGCLHCYP